MPRQVIRRWTVRANAISYAFLVALVLIGWLLPRASQPLFELMRPLNERLVGVVFRLANQGSGSRSGETALMQAVGAGDLPTPRKLTAGAAPGKSADTDGN